VALERVRYIIGPGVTAAHVAWLSLLAAAGLSVLGVYAIDVATSSTPPPGVVSLSGSPLKQMVYIAVGVLAAAMVALPHYKVVRFLAWPAMAASICVLIFLLIPFVPRWLVSPQNGARGWITLGPVNIQPAEVVKIVYVLCIADYMRFRTQHRRLLGLLPPALITFLPIALITLQPDLGTAMLFVPSLFAMLVAAGAKLRHLTLVVVLAALAAPASYPILMPHQQARIKGLVMAFQGDTQGDDTINYQRNAAQAIAGAGGWTGLPDAKSRALVYYNVLPEPHTDMIFAVIVNRFGLLGGVGVLGLYLMWVAGALATAAICRDAFGRLVVVGCTAFLVAQVVVNVGMTLGLMPIIGITLPFLSFGGSSMVTVWVMTGLVFSIGMRRPLPPFRDSFEYGEG
jgi:cell division protein FtsW (lipid II flippase)